MYQDLDEKGKTTFKRHVCMKLYDAARPLYLEADTSRLGLGARMLQMWDSMICGHDDILLNAML